MLTRLFDEALLYAARVHRQQRRNGTQVPYIAHLLAVCALVLEAGGDEPPAIAALLHDAAEDQGGQARIEDIRLRFGDRVAEIVEGCTDSLDDPRPPWRARKEIYLDHLRSAPEDVLLVTLADKLHNARSILSDLRAAGTDTWERFDAGRDYGAWYLPALAAILAERRPGPLADELRAAVDEIGGRLRTGV